MKNFCVGWWSAPLMGAVYPFLGKMMVYFNFFLGLRLDVRPQAFLRQLVALG